MCRAARQMVLSEQEESGMKKTCRSGKYFYRILAAIFWMQTAAVAAYLPFLLVMSVPLGLVTGLTCSVVLAHMKKIEFHV